MTLTTPRLDAALRPLAGCNRLLEALSAVDFDLIQKHLRPTALAAGQVLFEPGDDIVASYFPCEGAVTAIMIVTEDGKYIEAATIGREGAIGGIVSHGHKPAFGRGVVQIAGQALRLSSDQLEEAKRKSPRIADLFARYADFLIAQVMQLSACNGLHSVEQRLCRMLVMAHDRTGEQELDFTQQTLADSLGVQRTTITAVVKELEERGVVRTRRGHIQLADRAAVERCACSCYRSLDEHFGRLLPKVPA
jgi:CRP-like cAMP-binding protein